MSEDKFFSRLYRELTLLRELFYSVEEWRWAELGEVGVTTEDLKNNYRKVVLFYNGREETKPPGWDQ